MLREPLLFRYHIRSNARILLKGRQDADGGYMEAAFRGAPRAYGTIIPRHDDPAYVAILRKS